MPLPAGPVDRQDEAAGRHARDNVAVEVPPAKPGIDRSQRQVFVSFRGADLPDRPHHLAEGGEAGCRVGKPLLRKRPQRARRRG